MKKKTRSKRSRGPADWLLLFGIVMLLFPVAATIYTSFKTQQEVKEFNASLAEKAEAEAFPKRQDADGQHAPQESNGLSGIPSAGPGQEMIARIEIPRLKVNLPVYYGVSDQTLRRAVAVLEHSSPPGGGRNCHTVITGHRGTYDADILANADMLEPGDYIYLFIRPCPIVYRVSGKEIVEPYDTSALAPQKDKDLLTLVTCTPKFINSHRLLVFSERDPAKEAEVSREISEKTAAAAAENQAKAAAEAVQSLQLEARQGAAKQTWIAKLRDAWHLSNKYNLFLPPLLLAAWLWYRYRSKKEKTTDERPKRSDENGYTEKRKEKKD